MSYYLQPKIFWITSLKFTFKQKVIRYWYIDSLDMYYQIIFSKRVESLHSYFQYIQIRAVFVYILLYSFNTLLLISRTKNTVLEEEWV